MLKLTWIEFLMRNIPEVSMLIWGMHVISRQALNMKKYIICSLTMALLTFYVRMLPIYFGVHMIINIVLYISIMVIVGVPIIKSIYSTLSMFFMLTLSEFLNMVILTKLDVNVNAEFSDPIMKCLLGIPSLIVIAVVIMFIKLFLKYGRRNRECF